jgi:hypothetical protein
MFKIFKRKIHVYITCYVLTTKSTCRLSYVKKIKLGAKNKEFVKHVLSFYIGHTKKSHHCTNVHKLLRCRCEKIVEFFW